MDAQLVTLNTENGTIKGDVIVQEEIQELPLAGRDFTDLAFFTPGVVPKAEGGQGSFANINGARASNTNFFVDGFDNRNARGAAAQIRPNIDALQEFKMEVSGYSAEYGRMAGGILNMSLRSGTNEFHGNINYFLRNDINDARGFFEAKKNKLRQNQFAATVAGPIVKNKTFFMMSYEGMRRIADATKLARVPTALERSGDFSDSLTWDNKTLYLRDRLASGPCNANNQKSCFANNIIPESRKDPIGMAIQEYYPGVNRVSGSDARIGFNYLVQYPDRDYWDSLLFKVDHKLGENNLAFRYQKRWNDTTNPFAGGSDLGTYGSKIDDKRSLGGLDYTHMFSPTVLLELRTGFSRNGAYQTGFYPGQDIASQLGMPNLIPEGQAQDLPASLDWPRFLVDNYAQIGTGNNQPVQFFTTDWQYGAKLTWIKGKHNMKFGFNSNFVQFNQPYYNNQRGQYRTRGRRTGNALADLQLGWLHVVTRQLGFNRNYWRQHALGAFINDDWKATRKLTLNLGMRWEVNRAPWDKYDRLGVYDTERLKLVIASDENTPADYQALLDRAGVRDAVVTAPELGLSRSVVKTDWINFSPRVGFAYRWATGPSFGEDTASSLPAISSTTCATTSRISSRSRSTRPSPARTTSRRWSPTRRRSPIRKRCSPARPRPMASRWFRSRPTCSPGTSRLSANCSGALPWRSTIAARRAHTCSGATTSTSRIAPLTATWRAKASRGRSRSGTRSTSSRLPLLLSTTHSTRRGASAAAAGCSGGSTTPTRSRSIRRRRPTASLKAASRRRSTPAIWRWTVVARTGIVGTSLPQ
ncbi:MAG: TonB-dependent receptor [Bryobacterales bacterium]